MFRLLVAVATAVAACVIIYSRKRRQARDAAGEARRKGQEEERREAQQETWRRAEEDERQRLKAELRQLKEELRKAEEERCKAEEQRERLEEKVRRQADKLQELEKELRRFEEECKRLEKELRSKGTGEIEPDERGGRPRGPKVRAGDQQPEETKPRRPKPEIVCWKRERQWIPAVEVPEELLENPGLAVLQNGSPLPQDESREACWHLKQAFGEVVVKWTQSEDVQEAKVALGQEGYLLFKLSGQNQNQGRRVKFPSSGSYLVIVPDNWERDDVLSGPPPAAPEPVSLAGYKAHFFDLEKGGKMAFCTLEGKPPVIKSETSRFELVGTRLNDASEDIGPLFGERPPQIRARDAQVWRDVKTIVVGEEGSGRRRWRTYFGPAPDGMEQDLPSDVVNRKGGWYFLRFYDANDDLIESLDFRFMCALKEIRIPQSSPFPSEDGHRQVCVEFLHESGCAVEPADGFAGTIQIEREDDKTILTIPPYPTCDETRWFVGPENGPEVEVTILVERLWWALGEEGAGPLEWKDEVIILSRDSFTTTSRKALWLRFPRRRWVDSVLVGFQQARARPYTTKVAEKTVAIPLRDFGDAQELQNVGIAPLNLWICLQGTTYTGTFCELIVKLGCRFCDFLTSRKEDVFSHVDSLHLDQLFPPLTWEEMRDRNHSLPPKIYKCSYCNFYVASDNPPLNPTSAICSHIEESHRSEKRFRVISNVDEIRENVIRGLPRIHKCKLCGTHLEEATKSDKMQHLVGNHRNRLYEFR